jgi:hypothetical protein
VNGLRRNFTFAELTSTTVGQEAQGSDYSYDKLMEWDGGEPNNNDVLPLTRLNVFNATMVAGNTSRLGIHLRLETQLGFHNSIIENSAFAFRMDDFIVGGSYGTRLNANNVRGFRAGTSLMTRFLSIPTVGLTETGPGIDIASASQLVAPTAGASLAETLYQQNGLDLRLAATAGARTAPSSGAITPPANDIFVPISSGGSMKDNNFLAGWSVLQRIGALPATNAARVSITMGITGANPTVSFPTANNVEYVVERSVNQKTWLPIAVSPGTGSAVTVTDAGATLTAPVFYRVYAL